MCVCVQFTRAESLQARLLEGSRPYVLGSLLGTPMLMLGDVGLARALLAREGEDIVVGYPPSTQALLGQQQLTVVSDRGQHSALRRLLNPAFRQVRRASGA